MAERTLVIIKPDAIQHRLAGEVIGRFEKRGFKLVVGKFVKIPEERASQLYDMMLIRRKHFLRNW